MEDLKPKENNLTDKYSQSIFNLCEIEFDQSTIHMAKLCILDYIGVTLAGSKVLESNIKELLSNIGPNNGNKKILGSEFYCSFENAVFINGLSSHVLELDDGVRYGAMHPGAPILSALLPYAKKNELCGMDIIKGTIIGYEAAINLAYSIQPSHTNKGHHPSATCGSIGAAVALAVSDKFSEKKLKAVITNAAISAAGTLKVIEGKSQLKPSNIAKASLNALYAIYLANIEFDVPEDVLSGKNGFLSILADEYDEKRLLNLNDKSFKINKVYFKIFAACRHCHSGIDAAINLRNSHEICVEEIKIINIYSYDYVIGKHDHNKVDNPSSAKMSIPYSVAIALLYGNGSEEYYTDLYINDINVQKLMKKITVTSVKELSDLVPVKRPAILEIYMQNGDILKERIDFPKGEPENPLTDTELIAKFISLASYANKSKEDIDNIIMYVMDIENNFDKLYKLL